jgi:hypothetical protein
MTPRSCASLALAVLALAGLAAAPVRAGGPLEPPDGGFHGFRTVYLIPPTFLDSSGKGECLRVMCWSSSHDGVRLGVQLWNEGNDPHRAPSASGSLMLDPMSDLDATTLCPHGAQAHVGRVMAAPRRKLKVECAAELTSHPKGDTLAVVPLRKTDRKR